MAKPHYSLAEAFQRGLEQIKSPAKEDKVSYWLRIYPESRAEIPAGMQRELDDLQRRMKSSEPEKVAEYNEELEAIKLRYPIEGEQYGWTVSIDYCNDSTDEIIQRVELTRAQFSDLSAEIFNLASLITDKRQAALYRKLLAELAEYAKDRYKYEPPIITVKEE